MKVKELIRQLKQQDPEARVYYGSWLGKGRNEILLCFGYQGNKDVILEDASEFDVAEEIKSRLDHYSENGYYELDAYQEMVDCGFTPDVVAKYYDKEIAKHMEDFCDEHGIG